MRVVNIDVGQKVHEYIQRYTPETQLPRRALVPLPSDNEVISVPQRLYSFSRGDSTHKRYLETLGLGPCIGLTVYDPQTKVGCIAHLDNDRGIKPKYEDLESHFLLKLAHDFKRFNSPGPYQVRIVGGWNGISEETLLPLFETLHHLDPFTIVELAALQPMPWGSDSLDIILDLEDGVLYNSSIRGRSRDKKLERMVDILILDPIGIYVLHRDPRGL